MQILSDRERANERGDRDVAREASHIMEETRVRHAVDQIVDLLAGVIAQTNGTDPRQADLRTGEAASVRSSLRQTTG